MKTTAELDKADEAGVLPSPAHARRGGRPRLAERDQRRHKVTVSLNDKEKKVVEGKAAQAGLPVAAYLRASGLGQRLDRRVNAQVYHQLARLGVNVNQMAREANAGGRLPELERLEALAEVLLALRRAL